MLEPRSKLDLPSRFFRVPLEGLDRALLLLIVLAWSEVSRASSRLPPLSLAPEYLAAPLTTFGLWLLSLFFLRKGSPRWSAWLLQLGVLAYAAVYVFRQPVPFWMGSCLWLTIFTWGVALAALLSAPLSPSRLGAALLFWGATIFPAAWLLWWGDLQHFLWLTPLLSFYLVVALALLSERYRALPRIWLRLPAILWLGGAIYFRWWEACS